MRKNSVKNTRINSEVLRELSRIISREIKDPRISAMTTVVAVEVAPDLKTCKAYISVLGSEEEQESTLEGLKMPTGISKGSWPTALICAIRRISGLFWINPLRME